MLFGVLQLEAPQIFLQIAIKQQQKISIKIIRKLGRSRRQKAAAASKINFIEALFGSSVCVCVHIAKLNGFRIHFNLIFIMVNMDFLSLALARLYMSAAALVVVLICITLAPLERAMESV
jgi:predicted ABC-type ATPase